MGHDLAFPTGLEPRFPFAAHASRQITLTTAWNFTYYRRLSGLGAGDYMSTCAETHKGAKLFLAVADVAQARVDGDNWTVPSGHRRPTPVCSLSATAPHREHLFWGDTMLKMSRRSANTYGSIGEDSRHRFGDPDDIHIHSDSQHVAVTVTPCKLNKPFDAV